MTFTQKITETLKLRIPAPLPRIDATGFEPATSASRTQRSTKLSHASFFRFSETCLIILTQMYGFVHTFFQLFSFIFLSGKKNRDAAGTSRF